MFPKKKKNSSFKKGVAQRTYRNPLLPEILKKFGICGGKESNLKIWCDDGTLKVGDIFIVITTYGRAIIS